MPGQIVLNAHDVVHRHMHWKITVQLAITVREPLTPEQVQQIEDFRRCAIGAWLESAATLSIRKTAEHAELNRSHIRFHDELVSIAQLLHGRCFEDAAKATQPGSGFSVASDAFSAAVLACNRILPVAAPLPMGTVFSPPVIGPR